MQNLITKTRLLSVPCLNKLNNRASFANLTIPKRKTTGKKRFRLEPVSQDPEYLCSHVAGLNYRSDWEEVKIKPDSEYPDWIWDLRLDKHPGHEIYDPNTKEFWENVAYENKIRVRRLLKHRERPSKILMPHLLEQKILNERFKERLAKMEEFDQGYDPEELKPKLHEQLAFRPQVQDEVIYADEIDLPKSYRELRINEAYLNKKNDPFKH